MFLEWAYGLEIQKSEVLGSLAFVYKTTRIQRL